MRNGWTGRILWVTAALWLAWTPVGADTWLLEKDGEWQNLAEGDQGRYVVLVSRIKRLIADGQVEEAHRVLDELTEAYPSVAGPDLKAFMEAETLYARNDWDKAIRQYNAFMDAYPDSWLYEAALEREYSIAVAYLSGEKRQVLGVLNMSAYDEAATILHNIADRAGDAPIAQRALVALARNYAERGEFMDAY